MNTQVHDQALFAALDAREFEPMERCDFTERTDSQTATYQAKAVTAAAAAGIPAPAETAVTPLDGGQQVEFDFPFAKATVYLHDNGECAYSEVDADSRYFDAFIEGFTA
jgi:hypothetical protein